MDVHNSGVVVLIPRNNREFLRTIYSAMELQSVGILLVFDYATLTLHNI